MRRAEEEARSSAQQEAEKKKKQADEEAMGAHAALGGSNATSTPAEDDARSWDGKHRGTLL